MSLHPVKVCEVELSEPVSGITAPGHESALVLARWYSEPLAVVDIPLRDGAADAGQVGPGALAVRRAAGQSPVFGRGDAEHRAAGAGRWGARQHRWQPRRGGRGRLRPSSAVRRGPSAAVAAVVPDRPGDNAAERAAGQRGDLHQGPHRAAGQLPDGGAPPGLPGLRGHRGGQRPNRRRGGRPGGPPQGGRDERRSAAARRRAAARLVLGAQYRAARRLRADRRLSGRR